MKRILHPLLLLALAATCAVAAAQPADLPDDPRFDQTVAFQTGNDGEALPAMISALARAVGLTPIVDDVPDRQVHFDIAEPKPFRQVWDLVLTLNDMDYALQENDVVVVGTSDSLARLGGDDAPAESEAAEADEAEAQTAPAIVQRFYRVNNDPDEVVTLLQRAVEDADVEALPGVNSIVVEGTEAEHERIREVLDEFDTRVERAPLRQVVYPLSNADAEQLAGVLQETALVVPDTGGEAQGEGEDGLGGSDEDREFTVVADARTNSLIITATEPVQERIQELLPELDAPQQQVNVQVRIQEINQRTARNMGIDLSAGFGNMSANILNGGLDLIFDAQSVITSLNLGATLDALESQGLSRRVDDSNLTVLSNETGRMQSGGRIEITYPGNDGEISTRTIEFGVIVEVTPRISNDGRVILDVTAEVSDVSVPLSEGGIPERIDFDEREVTSTVTLEQGQTVLLGGLLQNSFSQTQRRVPVLGDIPVLGALFGSTEMENENGELLLVVRAQTLD